MRRSTLRPVDGGASVPAVSGSIVEKLAAALASSTRQAYQAQLTRLADWHGGNLDNLTDATLSQYLAALYESGASPASCSQAVAAVKCWCRMTDNPPPVGKLVHSVMGGIRREGSARGRGQRSGITHQQAQVMAAMAGGEGTAAGFRDAALVSVMSDGLLRVSEAVALEVSDIEAEGATTITIRKSKTDQAGKGAAVYASDQTIARLRAWLSVSGIESGAVFRGLYKDGSTRRRPLTAQAVRNILKARAAAAGLPAEAVGSHSLRIGMAQSLAAAGAGLVELQTAGRWQSPSMPGHYARGQLAARGAVAKLIYKA